VTGNRTAVVKFCFLLSMLNHNSLRGQTYLPVSEPTSFHTSSTNHQTSLPMSQPTVKYHVRNSKRPFAMRQTPYSMCPYAQAKDCLGASQAFSTSFTFGHTMLIGCVPVEWGVSCSRLLCIGTLLVSSVSTLGIKMSSSRLSSWISTGSRQQRLI
jgi:hypothetical protein